MDFKKTSRADDMISATYFLLTLLNNNELPCIGEKWTDYDQSTSMREKFHFLQNLKKKYNLVYMTNNMDHFEISQYF